MSLTNPRLDVSPRPPTPPSVRSSRAPDPAKSEIATAIRTARHRLTIISLRRLREKLLRHQLQQLELMAADGINLPSIRAIADAQQAITVVDALQAGRASPR